MIGKTQRIPSLAEVEGAILQRIAYYCNLELSNIDPSAPMENIAMDSILTMTIVEELQNEFNVDLPSFLFYEHETLRSSANYIIELMETARA